MKDTRTQPMVKVGELRAFNTWKALSLAEVKAYNRYTADFNRETYTETKEFLLDQRNRFYKSCCYCPQ